MIDQQDFLHARRRRRRWALGALGAGGAVVALALVAVVVMQQEPLVQPAPEPNATSAALTCPSDLTLLQAPHPCLDKQTFETTYRALTTQLLPSLEPLKAVDFVAQGLASVQEQRQAAVDAYDVSDYVLAAGEVLAAQDTATDLLRQVETRFAETFARAQAAFLNNHPDDASRLIARALALNPGEAAAMALAARIALLPEVLKYLDTAAVAEAENDFPTLKTALREAIRLDPARTELAPKLAAVEQRLREQDYAFAIRAARDALKTADLDQARVFAGVARGLFPGRPDIAQLEQDIKAAEKAERVARHLSAAQQLMADDDWPSVRDRFGAVLADEPGHIEAQQGFAKSEAILMAYDQTAALLDDPARLQDEGLRQLVLRFLDANAALEAESALLGETFAKVRGHLDDYTQTRRVIVRSDGRSDVQVRRVGKVGRFKTQDVFLAPGTYQFECKRKGFRSHIVSLTVPVRGDVPTVVIECTVPL